MNTRPEMNGSFPGDDLYLHPVEEYIRGDRLHEHG
jgi:hypothetical protein